VRYPGQHYTRNHAEIQNLENEINDKIHGKN